MILVEHKNTEMTSPITYKYEVLAEANTKYAEIIKDATYNYNPIVTSVRILVNDIVYLAKTNIVSRPMPKSNNYRLPEQVIDDNYYELTLDDKVLFTCTSLPNIKVKLQQLNNPNVICTYYTYDYQNEYYNKIELLQERRK